MSAQQDQTLDICSSPKSVEASSGRASPACSDASADSSEPCSSTASRDLESQKSATDTQSAGAALLRRLYEMDIRPKLPFWISRFLGYRPDGVCRPIWALRWLETFNVPLTLEEYAACSVKTLFGMICVLMINTMTPLASLPIPLSLGFVGALSITLSLTPQSLAATPRNTLLSHLFASVTATFIGKYLHSERDRHIIVLDHMSQQTIWVWACVAVTITILFQKTFNLFHPSAGGTALAGTIQPGLIRIGWHYVGFVMSGVTVMVGLSLVFGNIGRSSYPGFWFIAPNPPSKASPQSTKPDQKVNDSNVSFTDSEGKIDMSRQSAESSKRSKESLSVESRSAFGSFGEKDLTLSGQPFHDKKHAALSKTSSRNVATRNRCLSV